jgi:hypothetical protein
MAAASTLPFATHFSTTRPLANLVRGEDRTVFL